MTVSTHVYAAYVVGSPDVALRLKGGSIDLDDTRAPHVQGTVSVAIPTEATLALLDPRLGKRVRVDVTATYPTGTQTRSFNLGIRDRDVRHLAGDVTLTLASDEAILADYAPLADDTNTFTYQGSLRGVCNYVLGKIGASLAAAPSGDAVVTTYADSVNLIPDPSNEGSGAIFTGTSVSLDKADTSWFAAGSKSINLYSPANNGAFMSVNGDTGGMRNGMVAGKTYMLSATGRVKMALTGTAGANARQLVVYYRDGVGGYPSIQSPQIVNTVGTATRVSMIFTLPATATEAFVRAYHGYTGGEIQWDAFRLSEYTGDPTDTGFYDGSTTATAGYSYGWSNGANTSTSTRKALIDRAPASLTWKAGQSALDFLLPIVQAAGFRPVCDENRVWTLRPAAYEASGAVSIRHGVNLIDGSDQIKRDEGLWFDAQVTRYRWNDAAGISQERIDAYALTGAPVRVNLVDIAAPFPGAGRSQYAVQRAQAMGRTVTATAVADWRVTAEQWSEFYLVGAPVQTGKTSRVVFDLDNDRMTITSRTSDTPSSAWVLIPTGSKWTDQPAGGSWTAEAV